MCKIKINLLFLRFVFDILKFWRIVTGRRAFLELLTKSIGNFFLSSNYTSIFIFNMVQYFSVVFASNFSNLIPNLFYGCVAVDRRDILSPASTFFLFYSATAFSSNKLCTFNIFISMIFIAFSISCRSLFNNIFTIIVKPRFGFYSRICRVLLLLLKLLNDPLTSKVLLGHSRL